MAWLGLDVHDVGAYQVNGVERSFEPGMVLTIEPGLYIPTGSDCDPKWWGLAVRIEDDLLVALSSHPNFVKYRNNQYFGAQVDLFKKDSVITVKECMDLYRFMNQISQAEKKIEMESLMEKL